jgi:predicted ester cyclase
MNADASAWTRADGDHDPGATATVPDDAALTPSERRHLALARRHIEEIWARGHLDVAYELYAPDVVDMQPAPGQRPGIPGIVDVLGWLREAVPDLRMEILAYAVEGDYAADHWRMTGTHTGSPLLGMPARGRRFAIHGADVVRFRDGLIDRVWHVEEFARLRDQIR